MYYQQKSNQNPDQQRIYNPQSRQTGQQVQTTSQVKSPELNDRDRINDILATEKYLTDCFNTFTTEASHNQLYSDVKQILNDTHSCARDVFNLMYQQGSYNLEAAQQQKIQQSWNKFSNYLNSQAPY